MAGGDSSVTQGNNRNYVSRDGKSGTYDRNMQSYLKSKSPYNYSLLDTDESKNTKYKYFQHVGMRRPEAIAKNSVALNNDFNNTAYSSIEQDRSFGALMYAAADENKPGRLRDYRVMSAFSEVSDALDEICDGTINPDERDDIVTIKFKNSNLESTQKEELTKEFSRFVEYFDLENRGWNYFRQFLIEGELFFELIVHDDYINEGTLAVVNIPADQIDPVYSNIQNMLVKGFLYKKPIFDVNDPHKVDRFEYVQFEENQIVYINNGHYNETKEFIIPFIENCRRAYRQLSMIEDSIVIHRMVHAPLRFVFNVDVGRLPVPQAEAYLRKLQSQYWSTKTFDIDQTDVVKKYNPQSTLDSYWFSKRQGQEQTTVQTIGGATNLGSMDDLHFFIKKLYRSLKVPTSRLDPNDAFRDGTDILREELKLGECIKRQQRKFAAGIKRGFITHLKLRNMFDNDRYDITDENIKISFNVPSNFDEMRENQKLELKINTFNNIANNENVSPTFAMKTYLNWSDEDILANREFLRNDAKLMWELDMIRQGGPNWKENLLDNASGGGEPSAGGPPGGGMPSGGGMGDIPDFGGGEVGDADTEAPEAAPIDNSTPPNNEPTV